LFKHIISHFWLHIWQALGYLDIPSIIYINLSIYRSIYLSISLSHYISIYGKSVWIYQECFAIFRPHFLAEDSARDDRPGHHWAAQPSMRWTAAVEIW
jgi:hypothetical protein